MPPVLQPEDNQPPGIDFSADVDERPILVLRNQLTDALSQILCRAHSGDDQAISEFVLTVRRAVLSLGRLSGFEPDRVRAEAERVSHWPVLLSLNPQDIKHAKQHLSSLCVGAKAMTPTRKGQRLDRENFWTRLAFRAFCVCQEAGYFVPALKSHCGGLRGQRHTARCWGTEHAVTAYRRKGGSTIAFADWQADAARLSRPVNDSNFKQWWAAARASVIEYWNHFRTEYDEALRHVGCVQRDETTRRNLAVDRLKQSFKSLTGVRRGSS
jgi:hypothetical protein